MSLFARRVSDFFKQKKFYENAEVLRMNVVSWRFTAFASKTRIFSKELNQHYYSQ
jgi:hypothetical protein